MNRTLATGRGEVRLGDSGGGRRGWRAGEASGYRDLKRWCALDDATLETLKGVDKFHVHGNRLELLNGETVVAAFRTGE